MSGRIEIKRVSPNTTVQDLGRRNVLHFGLSASGPMDRRAVAENMQALSGQCGANFLEIGMLGISFQYFGPDMRCAFRGGAFGLTVNGAQKNWPAIIELKNGDEVEVSAGASGMYAYCHFLQTLDVARVLDSYATNLAAGVGGLDGRAIRAGDELNFTPEQMQSAPADYDGSNETQRKEVIRIIPGLHAELLGADKWHALFNAPFKISTSLDRMGIRLVDPTKRFDVSGLKSIVSDAVVAGDIQILGDGTPVILMRDHQPVGGYPRIATIIDADQDRLAQMRPNTEIWFQSVTLERAHKERKRAGQ